MECSRIIGPECGQEAENCAMLELFDGKVSDWISAFNDGQLRFFSWNVREENLLRSVWLASNTVLLVHGQYVVDTKRGCRTLVGSSIFQCA